MGEFVRITADGWIAIATVFGGLAVLTSGGAVLYGIFHGAAQVIREQEARDVRKGLIEDGIEGLRASFDQMLERTRLNFGLATRLLKHVQGSTGQPLARLRPSEVPSMLSDLPPLNARAMGPASQLIGAQRLGQLMTSAYAVLFSINCNLEFQTRHTVLNYYESGMTKQAIGDWPERAMDEAQDQYEMGEKYRAISVLLLMAAQLAQKERIRSFSEARELTNSEEMRAIASALDGLAVSTEAEYAEWSRNKD